MKPKSMSQSRLRIARDNACGRMAWFRRAVTAEYDYYEPIAPER